MDCGDIRDSSADASSRRRLQETGWKDTVKANPGHRRSRWEVSGFAGE